MSYEPYTEQIKEEALDLTVGASISAHCPACEFTQKPTMSISRERLGILYVCHRVNCGVKGFIPSISTGKRKEREFVPKPYEYDTKPMTSTIRRIIYQKYKFFPPPSWKVSSDNNRIVLPTKTAEGFEWGTYTKLLPGRTGLKTILYPHSEFKPRLHIPGFLGKEVYVVEDPISSERLRINDRPSACLLGTSINAYAVQYLANVGVQKLKLCLDFDAFKKSQQIRREYGLAFPEGIEVMVWDSRLDPKDMSIEEFNEVFRNE